MIANTILQQQTENHLGRGYGYIHHVFLSSDTDEVCGHQSQEDSQIRGSVL